MVTCEYRERVVMSATLAIMTSFQLLSCISLTSNTFLSLVANRYDENLSDTKIKMSEDEYDTMESAGMTASFLRQYCRENVELEASVIDSISHRFTSKSSLRAGKVYYTLRESRER